MLSLTANNIKSPVRSIRGCVEVYRASTLLNTYTYKDALQEFTLERVSEEGKFFGFGICQKVNVKLRDVDRVIDVAAKDYFKVGLDSDGEDYAFKTGNYHITEVRRDENTNALTLYAYDKIYDAASHYTRELDLSTCSTFGDYITVIADFLGLDGVVLYIADSELAGFNAKAANANLEGSETLRELLDDIAEATQTVYYVNYQNKLVFRRISKENYNLTISKDDYFTLSCKGNRRLQTICATTQLGENYSASTSQIGTTQYIRDNDFWTNNKDTPAEVEAALALYGNLTIAQFECEWRGNYLLEVGDRLRIENKDGSYSYSYLYDDTITYNGALQEKTKWSYKEDMESAANPTNLGDKLKQTFAIVDKANKQIEMVVSKSEEMENTLSQIQLDTEGISATVENQKIQTDKKLAELTSSVNTKMTANDVIVEIQNQIKENGNPNSITTSTGFTFNEDGLNISKSGSDLTTIITDNGMRIDRYGEAVLTANNSGVDAKNLHATTYLFIGVNSRFEDYDNNTRTGCFWIGG